MVRTLTGQQFFVSYKPDTRFSTLRNLRGTIFYMKTNVLQDLYICINVPFIFSFEIVRNAITKSIIVILRRIYVRISQSLKYGVSRFYMIFFDDIDVISET